MTHTFLKVLDLDRLSLPSLQLFHVTCLEPRFSFGRSRKVISRNHGGNPKELIFHRRKWFFIRPYVHATYSYFVFYFSPICKHKLRAIKRLKTVKMSSNGLAVSKVLEQIHMVQGMIDMNASSLNSLRTQFSTNSDLIQQEIRTLEVNIIT